MAALWVDNDNFRMDTLAGGAPQANRTNTMFVQEESKNKTVQAIDIPNKRAARLSASLKELNKSMKDITLYKTTKWAEPPIREKPTIQQPKPDTMIQRKRNVIHALTRADDDLNRPDVNEQKVPSISGKIYYIQLLYTEFLV